MKNEKKKGKGYKVIAGLLLIPILLTSCVSDPNFKAYVIAHRLSFDARNTTYLSLVDKSPDISPIDKETIKRKEAEEAAAISAAETYLGIK